MPVAATEIPETVQQVFSMELLKISSMCEVGNHKVFLGLPSDLLRKEVNFFLNLLNTSVETVTLSRVNFFKPFPKICQQNFLHFK